VASALDGIVGFFEKLPGRILGALKGFGSLLLQKGRDLVNGLRDGIFEVAERVTGFFKGLPSQIKIWLGRLGGVLYSAGAELIEGFLAGIAAKIPLIGPRLAGAVGKAKAAARKELDSNSPSKVFMRIGEDVIAGFTLGIDRSAPDVFKSMSSVAARLRTTDFTLGPVGTHALPSAVSNPDLAGGSTVTAARSGGINIENVSVLDLPALERNLDFYARSKMAGG
jgi:hypothetical protein